MLGHELHDLDERETTIGHIGVDALLLFPKLADPRPLPATQVGHTPIDVILVPLPGATSFRQFVPVDPCQNLRIGGIQFLWRVRVGTGRRRCSTNRAPARRLGHYARVDLEHLTF